MFSARRLATFLCGGAAVAQAINYYSPETQPMSLVDLAYARQLKHVPKDLNLTYKHQLFPVVDVKEVSPDVSIISFGLGEGQTFHLDAAQTLQCGLYDYGMGRRITRHYTPITPNGTEGYFDVMIKRYADGYMSRRVTALKVGEAFEWAKIPPAFVYKKNTYDQVYMICGGVGITPMLQLIRTIVSDPNDVTKMKLLYCNRLESDILLKEELDGLMKKYPGRFHVSYTVDKPSAEWKGEVGHVTPDMITRTLTSKPQPREHLFVCGSDGFMNHIAGAPPAVMMYWSGKQKTQPTFQGVNNLAPVQGLLGPFGWNDTNCWRF